MSVALMIKTIYALVSYAGPLDDPRIGWLGLNPSTKDHFQCERCGKESLDSSKIEHVDGCSAAALLDALQELRRLR